MDVGKSFDLRGNYPKLQDPPRAQNKHETPRPSRGDTCMTQLAQPGTGTREKHEAELKVRHTRRRKTSSDYFSEKVNHVAPLPWRETVP